MCDFTPSMLKASNDCSLKIIFLFCFLLLFLWYKLDNTLAFFDMCLILGKPRIKHISKNARALSITYLIKAARNSVYLVSLITCIAMDAF